MAGLPGYQGEFEEAVRERWCFVHPDEVHHPSHVHPLTKCQAPNFTCDVCSKPRLSLGYSCAACNFKAHLECVIQDERQNREDFEARLQVWFRDQYEEDCKPVLPWRK